MDAFPAFMRNYFRDGSLDFYDKGDFFHKQLRDVCFVSIYFPIEFIEKFNAIIGS